MCSVTVDTMHALLREPLMDQCRLLSSAVFFTLKHVCACSRASRSGPVVAFSTAMCDNTGSAVSCVFAMKTAKFLTGIFVPRVLRSPISGTAGIVQRSQKFYLHFTFHLQKYSISCIQFVLNRTVGRCTIYILLYGWLHGTVVVRRTLAGELSLSCARPAADG